MSSDNEHIPKPKPKLTRKANESDAAYVDRLMANLYGRPVRAAKMHTKRVR